MKRISVVLAACLAAFWLAGCTAWSETGPEGTQPKAGDELAGTRWQVATIAGQGLPDGVRPTVAFGADGRISGMAGCNRYSGRYRLEGQRLAVSDLASTRRICFPAVMIQEQSLLRVLEDVQRIERNAGELLLHSSHERQGSRLLLLPEAEPAG